MKALQRVAIGCCGFVLLSMMIACGSSGMLGYGEVKPNGTQVLPADSQNDAAETDPSANQDE